MKGGVLNIPNTVAHVGRDAYAKLNISGGEANLKGINLSAGGKTKNNVLGGKGFLNLTGGTLNLGSEGVTYLKKKPNTSYNSEIAPEINLGNGTVNASASHTWANNLTVTLTDTTVFNADSDKTITIASVVQGSGGLKKTGAGTLTLSGANTYTGATTISAGTLKLTGNGTLGTGAVSVASGTALKFNYDADKTLTNAISGEGTIVKEGTNKVSFTGTNTFTGDLAINGGTLSFPIDTTNQHLNVKNLSGSGELELRMASGSSDAKLPNLTNDGFTGVISLVQSGNPSSTKINTNKQSFEGFKFKLNSGTSIYITGAEFKADVQLAGNGNSENRGALRVANTLSGNLTVMADANIGLDGNRTISSQIVSGAASGETTLFINGKTDGATVTANANAGTFTGAISDGTSGSKLGLNIVSNTQTFSGALSYTGATTINSGAVMSLTGANTNLAKSRAVTVNGTLTFTDYTGTDAMRLNDLTGTNGTINGTGKNLTLYNDDDTKFTGSITAAAITKSGDGTLKVNGTITASSLTVTGGQFDLKGNSTCGLTISGAVFSPGNSVGTAEVGGAFTLTDGASVLLEIGGKAPNKNDSLVATGNLELGDGKIHLTLADACDLKPGDEFTAVFSGSNSYSFNDFINDHVVSYYFTNLAYVPYGDGQYAITGILDSNAMPEPAAWLLLMLGAFGLLKLRKR